MKAKLIINFGALSEAAFLARAETILAAVNANPAFPEPWPAPISPSSALALALQTYALAYTAAQSGDKQKIAARQDARASLTEMLKTLAPYLEMTAAYDRAKLLSTGYELRRDSVKGSAANLDVLPAPADFKVARGALSGAITVHARRLEGAGSYEVQTTLADPTVETNWAYAGAFMRCSKIELAGLVPGKPVSVRLRGIGSHSPGAWTTASTVMVV